MFQLRYQKSYLIAILNTPIKNLEYYLLQNCLRKGGKCTCTVLLRYCHTWGHAQGAEMNRELPTPIWDKAQVILGNITVLDPKSSADFWNYGYAFKKDSLHLAHNTYVQFVCLYLLFKMSIKKLIWQEFPEFLLLLEVKHSKPCKTV